MVKPNLREAGKYTPPMSPRQAVDEYMISLQGIEELWQVSSNPME
jgi:hypothetical protein